MVGNQFVDTIRFSVEGCEAVSTALAGLHKQKPRKLAMAKIIDTTILKQLLNGQNTAQVQLQLITKTNATFVVVADGQLSIMSATVPLTAIGVPSGLKLGEFYTVNNQGELSTVSAEPDLPAPTKPAGSQESNGASEADFFQHASKKCW